jgi:hypothetical protein
MRTLHSNRHATVCMPLGSCVPCFGLLPMLPHVTFAVLPLTPHCCYHPLCAPRVATHLLSWLLPMLLHVTFAVLPLTPYSGYHLLCAPSMPTQATLTHVPLAKQIHPACREPLQIDAPSLHALLTEVGCGVSWQQALQLQHARTSAGWVGTGQEQVTVSTS